MSLDVHISVDVKHKKKEQRILRKLADFEMREVWVGIFGENARRRVKLPSGSFKTKSKNQQSKINVGYIAYRNEFGYEYTVQKDTMFRSPRDPKKTVFIPKGKVIVVPPRPAFRSIISNGAIKKAIDVKVIELITQTLIGAGTAHKTYKQIGEVFKEAIRQAYLNFNSPRNAKLTIFLKGFDSPLKDTKTNILPAINYKVIKGNSLGADLKAELSSFSTTKIQDKPVGGVQGMRNVLKTVQIREYTRKDGTVVKTHLRNYGFAKDSMTYE